MGGNDMIQSINTEDMKVGDTFFVLPRGDLLSAMKRVRKLEVTSIDFLYEKVKDPRYKQPNAPLLRYDIKAKELISPVKISEKEICYAAYHGHVFIPNNGTIQTTPVNKMTIRFSSFEALKCYLVLQSFNQTNEIKENIRKAEQELFQMRLDVNKYESECKEVIGSLNLLKKGLKE
jgi:hypothetical protein